MGRHKTGPRKTHQSVGWPKHAIQTYRATQVELTLVNPNKRAPITSTI